MIDEPLHVEALRTPRAMTVIEDLQREIWGYGEPGADPPYPARALFALAESGGLISLARIGSEPAGFAVAWLGRLDNGNPYLHSQLLGVRAFFRRAGIARALKLHQRDYALELGLDLVRWTFDPLRAANARLNLRRLGAICGEYMANYYGPLGSRFSSGDDSDRVWADWHILSPRVRTRLQGHDPESLASALPAVTCTELVTPAGVFRVPAGWTRLDTETCVLIEIPADLDLLRAGRPDLAAQWRLNLREVLSHHLERGYLVTAIREASEPGAGPSYQLERRQRELILAGHGTSY